MRFQAEQHNNKATKLEEKGQIEKAIACYEKAIKTDPRWSVPWYNLGLLYKRQRAWEKSLACNQRAVKLDARDKAAWWNMGIAATALDDWQEARRAWTAYGIKIESEDGPIEMDLGPVPIRINPDGGGEVVWCNRIDPARAIIESIPLPESNHRFGDLLLHDGAPNGYRKVGNQEVPVFDELQLLAPSEFGTYEVLVDAVMPEALNVMIDEANSADDLAVEDWGTLRRLCKACSEGRPFDENHIHKQEAETERRIGFAAASEQRVNELLIIWREKLPAVEFSQVQCVLQPVRGN
jgi:hypothetical protein